MRATIPPLICTLALATTTFAQKPVEDLTSTVSGRVFCADTNAPARTASVILQPVEVVKALEAGPGHHYDFSGERVQTLLDGTFTIHHVKAGAYYVVASLPGYLSPFPAVEDPDPDPASSKPETAKKPAIAAPLITVQSGLPVTVNVTLERGASVSGTVLFDDGSPAVGLSVTLLVQAKNSWGQLSEVEASPAVGDMGGKQSPSPTAMSS